jgi:uncharacterized phiE125 gp8 family phage protein
MYFELAPIPASDLPLDAAKSHLLLGSTFEDAAVQEPVLAGFLRAAITVIERRLSLVMLQRQFGYDAFESPETQMLSLPLWPVKQLLSVSLHMAHNVRHLPKEGFNLPLEKGRAQVHGCFPKLLNGGFCRISIMAGQYVNWAGIPADLQQAVLLLCSHYYENRDESGLAQSSMPFGILSLLEPHKRPRLRAGRLL